MKILISLLFGLTLFFASLQSKGAIVEGSKLQNFVEKKIPASNAGDISSHNPYHDLFMIVQQRNPGVQMRFSNVDGYWKREQYLMHVSSVYAYQFKKLFPSYFRSIGLLLIFPKHYFL